MRVQRILVILLGISVFLVSCSQHEESLHAEEEEINFFDYPSEVRLPTALWDLLEEKKVIDNLGKVVATTLNAKAFEENVFVGVTVHLKEKTPGILGGRDLKINGVRAGLQVDFSRFLKKDRGTFYLTIEPRHPLDTGSAQVFFLSHSLSRKLDGQTVGAGCNKFFEITKPYLQTLKETGLPVNVTDGRHVSLLAGTFFIRVAHETGVRKLTQVTFTDTRFPELLCDKQGEEEL